MLLGWKPLETMAQINMFEICHFFVAQPSVWVCRCSFSAEAPGRVPGGRYMHGGQLGSARLGCVLATDHQL